LGDIAGREASRNRTIRDKENKNKPRTNNESKENGTGKPKSQYQEHNSANE
jgi:hypothetical protein